MSAVRKAGQAVIEGECANPPFILETFGHLPEMEDAIRAVRSIADLPIVAQVAVGKRGVTREGVDPGQAAATMAEAGADVVGVNCSEALSVLDALEGMRQVVPAPLCSGCRSALCL